MSHQLIKALKPQLAMLWPSLTAQAGEFKSLGGERSQQQGDYRLVELELIFAKAKLIQKTSWNAQGQMEGLFFSPGQLPEEVPDPAQSEITVDAGTGFPLKGLLTLPETAEKVPAVVLIHGSGPSDRDESVGANFPFRDLALGLKEKGIASIRYDKRTLTYGSDIAQDPKFTIEGEFVEDAVAAVKLLKANPKIHGDRIFLLGHSQSGSLLAHIDQAGAQVRGYVVLAGTPRKLWELMEEQSQATAQALQEAGQSEKAETILKNLDLELPKAKKPARMTQEESADAGTIFGIQAWYLKNLEDQDPIAEYRGADKPMLFLQGEADRQVPLEDFQAWQRELKDLSDATFKSYADLNHLFGKSSREVPYHEIFNQEYMERTPVDPAVIQDLADWLLNH